MPLVDYQESLTRLQKALARAYARAPQVLNVPGKSALCKIDSRYYLALEPVFTEVLARWAASFPDNVRATLAHTGSLVVRRKPGGDPAFFAHAIPLVVTWGGRDYEIRAAFLLAEFVDRALKLYAGAPEPLPVSELRIRAARRKDVEALFAGLTPLEVFAFV